MHATSVGISQASVLGRLASDRALASFSADIMHLLQLLVTYGTRGNAEAKSEKQMYRLIAYWKF